VSARAETWLWIAQRLSAAVLGVSVTVHIVTIILAVQGGLSAAEIIARVQGNGILFAYYVVFAAAAAVHAPIGLRTVLREVLGRPSRSIDLFAMALGLLLVGAGTGAAWGLYAGGG